MLSRRLDLTRFRQASDFYSSRGKGKKLNNKNDDDKEGLKLARQERAQRAPVAKQDWTDWFGRRVSPAQLGSAF
jgi:hypothetical protein